MAEAEKIEETIDPEFKIIVEEYTKHRDGEKQKKKLAVLISTGSLNPVHIGHVEAFKTAKQQLEDDHNFKILGGFLSPSDSNWCSHKEHGCFSNEFRLKLVDLAVEDTWITASGWEMTQGMIDYPAVCYRFRDSLKELFPKDKVQVLYLCGTDHARKCGLMSGRKRYGVVVMTRPGYNAGGETQPENSVYIIEGKEIDASSTQVRRAIVSKNLESVKKLLHPKVYKALEDNDAEKLIAYDPRPSQASNKINKALHKVWGTS